MKIIFLDLDGVMIPPLERRIDPEPAALLKSLMAKHGAKVVLHSSWRLDPWYLSIFEQDWKDKGFSPDDYLGPAAPPSVSHRDKAVKHWLRCNPWPDSFVILDDENYIGFDQARLVQTFGWFNEEDFAKADAILGTPC